MLRKCARLVPVQREPLSWSDESRVDERLQPRGIDRGCVVADDDILAVSGIVPGYRP